MYAGVYSPGDMFLHTHCREYVHSTLNLVININSRIEQLFYRIILTAAGMFAGLPIASFKRRVYSAYILE